jgi:hypothetical protein
MPHIHASSTLKNILLSDNGFFCLCLQKKMQSVTGRVKTGDVGTQWGAALKRRCGVIAEQYKAAAAAQDHKAERVPALVGVGIRCALVQAAHPHVANRLASEGIG